MPAKVEKVVHGDDLLYRFFQSLFDDRADLAPAVLSRMYSTMGIWFPLELYYHFPILLPWVVRDPSCRGNKKKGLPEEWGSPDREGYLRDDNSLVKALTRSLVIDGTGMPHLHGARMGTEFVASHVWRLVHHEKLASRHPLLNSFVPNLVWLPSQVSKLTDREGAVMQRALQGLAWTIFRNAPVEPHLREVVEEAWKLVPEPAEPVADLPPLNTFVISEQYLLTRRARLRTVISALDLIEQGQPLTPGLVTSRYAEGLPQVGTTERSALKTFLRRFD